MATEALGPCGPARLEGPMPEPTFGHQPGSRACETCGKPTDADDFYFCNPCFDALPDSVVPRSRRYVLTPAGGGA